MPEKYHISRPSRKNWQLFFMEKGFFTFKILKMFCGSSPVWAKSQDVLMFFLQEIKLFLFTFFSVFLFSGLPAWNAKWRILNIHKNIFFLSWIHFSFSSEKPSESSGVEECWKIILETFFPPDTERKQCRAKWVNLSLGAPVAEWGETLQTWWNALRHILHYFVLVVNSSVWFCELCWWMSLTPDLPLCVCSSALCGHRLGPRDEEEILQRERGRGQWEHVCLLLTHRLTVKRFRKD